MKFILDHPEIACTSSFSSDLPSSLQSEVKDLLSWGTMAERKVLGATPKTFSNLVDLTASLRMDSATEDLETIPLTHDSSQLETCVAQLRDVLGPLIDETQLVQVALAADYNVNRALNFFFNGSSGGRGEQGEEGGPGGEEEGV